MRVLIVPFEVCSLLHFEGYAASPGHRGSERRDAGDCP
jgi:hypothetical protein